MKQLFTIVVLMVLNTFTFAQTTEITGVLKPNLNKVVYLFQIEDGETKLVKSVKLAEDGAFIFSFDPSYDGFYMVGGFTALAGQFPLYLKKGDKAQVSINNRKIEFIGQQTDENTVLAGWNSIADELKSKPLFFNLIKGKAAEFQTNIRTRNTRFNLLMKQVVDYELDFYRLNQIKKNIEPAAESQSEYSKVLLVKDKFKNDDVFFYPNGKALISLYADYAAGVNKTEDGTDFLSTDRQKGTYIFNLKSTKVKTYAQFEEMVNKYGKYFHYPSLKTKVDALGTKLYNATPGRKAANFSFPDQDGKMVSLSDFKGKVVLIDVWATFCGPCLALVPALNKLEAELHDQKDIVFIGVAQDGPKGKATWLKLIKERKMGGIQLFVGGANNVLAKDYKIKVMPRYLIFDRQGNVVTTEAPLPNNPALKKLLLAEISK